MVVIKDFGEATRALLASEGPTAEEVGRIRADILALAGAAEPRFCLHPNQTTEYRMQRGGWRRVRSGRRWRLVRRSSFGVYVLSCPDCPARMYQLDMGRRFEGWMAPWLLG